MFRYLNDHPQLERLYRNAGIVLSGNILSSLFGLGVLALVTRALTGEEFGLYALITAYVALVDRLTSFQTWQALIHFGSRFKEQRDDDALISLFTVGWLLDVAGGLAGFFLALLGAWVMPAVFGLDDAGFTLTAIAASVLVVNWMAAPTALIRLYDRFHLQAIYQNVAAGLTLATVAVLWLAGVNSLGPYVIGIAACGVVNRLAFFVLGIRVARTQGIWNPSAVSLRRVFDRTPRLWRYVWSTNADGIVRVLRDVDMFIVNALLGTSAAGLYKIARELTRVFGKLTGPFYQAIYPELARMAAAGRFADFSRLMRQSSLTLGALVGAGWIAFLLLGPYILPVVFGPEYAGAYPVAVAAMAGMVVWALAQPLSPAMMALGNVEVALGIHLVTSIAYVLALFALASWLGLAGAGVALFVFYLVWSLGMWAALRSQLRRQEPAAGGEILL